MANVIREPISAADLDEMRRELLRILNEVEHPCNRTDRQDACRRIQRLCGDGLIPEAIGDLMHVIRKCRNRAVYQDSLPQGMQALVIRCAWAVIRDWHLSNARRAH